MNYEEAIEYIHSVSWLGSRPGLSRIEKLCSLLGNIQDKLSFVHVAGTNGKGSFCSMLTQIYRNAGFRVGTFTSPYVYRFNERISVNGEEIPDDDLADVIERIKPLADSMEDTPTEFELISAAGFLYFYEQSCDIVILEAGMGGRLDSTNVIKTPKLSVITGIALDHTEYLGDTEEKIAFEKAGIIKKGVPLLCGKLSDAAEKVIENRAKEMGSPVTKCRYDRLSDISLSLEGASFRFSDYDSEFSLRLVGGYQPYNAALVISAAEILGLPKEAIYKGVGEAAWRGRFEVLGRDPTVIYDGGHNPDGVRAAVETVKQIFGSPINILSGVMKDKDYNLMASLIAPIARKVYCVTPGNPRALDAEGYAETFKALGISAQGHATMAEAVVSAYADSEENEVPLLAMGSLYMYGEFVDELKKTVKADQ